ncbi:hypothetical protein D6833_01090, partial [Candidatus Parcubacteria bacterium]
MTELWQPNNHSRWKVTYKALDPESAEARRIAAAVATHGSIGEAEAIAVLTGEDPSSSRNYRVKTTKGRFHVKELRRYVNNRALEGVVLELLPELHAHFKAAGVPTYEFILTRDGKPFFRHEGFPILIAPFVEGDHFRGERHELEQVGEVLGQLHQALDTFPGALPASEYVEIPFDPNSLEEIAAKNQTALKEGGDQFDNEAQKVITLLRQHMAPTLEALQQYMFPPSRTINDFHPH